MHVLCFLLWSCVAVAQVSADWQDGNDGVDRYGSDLPGMPVMLKNDSVARDCAALCSATAECKAWGYAKLNCGGNGQPGCWLKAVVPAQAKNPCRVTYG